MNQKGYLSHDYMADLFPRITDAVKDMPPCMPAIMIGYNGFYFLSPFNTIRGNRYIVRRVEGLELAQTIMDCIYIKCFETERMKYIRGVMPIITRNLLLSPAIEHDVKMSFITGDAKIVIQFAEDRELFTNAVVHEGGTMLGLELPSEGSAPRPQTGSS